MKVERMNKKQLIEHCESLGIDTIKEEEIRSC